MLSGDISLKFVFLFLFFLSGQSVTIKLLLIRIIRGCRLFFRGGIFVVGKKKKQKKKLHWLFLSVRRRLTSSTRAEPGELHIHCGEQMEFKKTVVNWWGDYSFRCSVAVIWEEEVASRIASGWQSSQFGAEKTVSTSGNRVAGLKRNAAQLRHRVHMVPPCWTLIKSVPLIPSQKKKMEC